MIIIGINGFKRSGKGETAAAVERLLKGDAVVKGVGFADKLKVLGAKALGFIDATDQECIDLMDQAKETWVLDIKRHVAVPDLLLEPYSPNVGRLAPGWETLEPVEQLTGRRYLQNLGNQARPIFGEDFWVDQVLPPIGLTPGAQRYALNAFYPGVDVLCITDLRYENEARRVKALGGVIWEVVRPGTGSDGHASEQPLPPELIDWMIHNDGNLDTLEDYVSEALRETTGL